jgi:hypothetical protein
MAGLEGAGLPHDPEECLRRMDQVNVIYFPAGPSADPEIVDPPY